MAATPGPAGLCHIGLPPSLAIAGNEDVLCNRQSQWHPAHVLVEIGRTVVLSDEGVEDLVHTEEHSALAVLHDHVPEAPFELARVLRAHRAEIVAARTIQLL